MPHKGRPYPFLFPRDLSRWGNQAIIALPKKFKWTTGSGLGTAITNWTFRNLTSDEGVWDYDTGEVTWHVPPPAGANPSTFMTLRYYLTFNAAQWNAEVRFKMNDGVTRTNPIILNFSNPAFWSFGQLWAPNPGLPVFFTFGMGVPVPENWPP